MESKTFFGGKSFGNSSASLFGAGNVRGNVRISFRVIILLVIRLVCAQTALELLVELLILFNNRCRGGRVCTLTKLNPRNGWCVLCVFLSRLGFLGFCVFCRSDDGQIWKWKKLNTRKIRFPCFLPIRRRTDLGKTRN